MFLIGLGVGDYGGALVRHAHDLLDTPRQTLVSTPTLFMIYDFTLYNIVYLYIYIYLFMYIIQYSLYYVSFEFVVMRH